MVSLARSALSAALCTTLSADPPADPPPALSADPPAGNVVLLSRDRPWDEVRALDVAVVLHDPLCPLLPASAITDAVTASAAAGQIVVGARPVSDTIKTNRGERVGHSVDRDLLVEVASPIVLPALAVSALTSWPDTDSFAVLVQSLRERFEVRFVEVPTVGRPVQDRSALEVLAAFDGLHLEPAPSRAPG